MNLPPNYKVGDTVQTIGLLRGMTGIVSDYYPPDIEDEEGHGGLTVFVVEIEDPSPYLDEDLATVGGEEHFAIWHPSQPWYSKCNGEDVPVIVNTAKSHSRLVNLIKKHPDWPERLWEENQKLKKALATNATLQAQVSNLQEMLNKETARRIALANLRQVQADENPAESN